MNAPRIATHPERYLVGEQMLQRGQYEIGWKLYESRVSRIEGHPPDFPEWRGEEVRSLVVLPEQGLGDHIMFARFIPLLKARGIDVTFVAPGPLVRLFEPLGVPIVPHHLEVPKAEAWVWICSLPACFGLTLETIPDGRYLPGGEGGGGIGLAWRGAPTHWNDAARSLPDRLAAELLALPGVRSLHPEDTGARDMEDTRRIVEGLDLVITVDSAVGHLAGAMGKPCWLLLPSPGEWRWMDGRTDSPWYPSHRLWRQSRPGDWREVVDGVKRRLDGPSRPSV